MGDLWQGAHRSRTVKEFVQNEGKQLLTVRGEKLQVMHIFKFRSVRMAKLFLLY